MDKGGTWTNGPNDMKIDDNAQGIISVRWQTDCVPRKGGRRRILARMENCVDASIQGLY